jgi:HTH-like domain/Integrase core domain
VICSNEPWPSGSRRRRHREPLPLRRYPEGRRVPGRRCRRRCRGVSRSLLCLGGQDHPGTVSGRAGRGRAVAEIRTVHTESGGTSGSPRVTAELGRRGWRVNHKRVERLMADHGLVGHRPRRRRSLTKPDAATPPAPDLLGRLVDPDQPDVTWCGDVTSIPTDEGWLYLASVLDLASRHLLGWSMGELHNARLVTDALDAAAATRGRQQMDATIFHTDRGSEYPRLLVLMPASGWGCGAPWPHRIVPGQRRRRELVRLSQGRAGRPTPLPYPSRGACLDLRLDRLVQPPATALHQRLPPADRVGTATPNQPPATITPGRITPVSGPRGKSKQT